MVVRRIRALKYVIDNRNDRVVISAQDGTRTAVPLWMVRAVPGIDLPAQRSAVPDHGAAFSPFGRTERRTLEVTPSDLDVLRGVPEPLRVLVPVTIDR